MYKYRRGFLKLLQRYITNTSSPDEKRVIDYWYESIDQPISAEKTDVAKQQLEDKLWQQIQLKTQDDAPILQPQPTSWFARNARKVAAVAAVVVLLGSVYYVTLSLRSVPAALNGLTAEQVSALSTFKNTTGSPRQIRLSDGSQVTLQPNASLYYPNVFSEKKRVVYLDGNGFFEISRNPQKPFWVYSESIVTKVLGTSFTIQKLEKSGDIEVAVKTGRVVVEKSGDSKGSNEVSTAGVVLTPNEKVTYRSDNGSYATGLVDNPVLVNPSNELLMPDAFSFTETPLIVVIEKLEKAYGVDITLVNESIADCPITASLPNESLFAKLDIINALLNTATDLKGTTIIMTGGECVPFKTP